MTFVTTGLLVAGVVSVAVPILIHLLSRQRRRPIEWAAMRFLIEALRKHRRRLQIEQLLLLATRCLILVLLGAALARPFLESTGVFDTGGSRVVFLVIDNGLASGVQTGVGDGDPEPALDRSVQRATRVISALGPGDSVAVITAARPARGVVIPPSGDHRAIVELLRSLEPAESPTDLPAAFEILGSALKDLGVQREQAVVYLFSDFRTGSARLETTLPTIQAASPDGGPQPPLLLASPAAQRLVPNTQVASIDPLRGLILASGDEGTGQVTVGVTRSGGELDREVSRVRLIGEGLPPIEPKIIQWEPGQLTATVDFVVNLGGRAEGGVSLAALIDDDALGADNHRHSVLVSRGSVRVLLIDRRGFGTDPSLDRLQSGQWIQRALQPSDRSPIDVVEVDPAALDPLDMRGVDAAILCRPDLINDRGWSVLRGFVDTRGLLLVVPPGDSNVHPWTDRLVESMDLPWRILLEVADLRPPQGLADQQPASELLQLLSGDLSALAAPVVVNRILPVDRRQTHAASILNLADGSPLMIAGSPNQPVGGNGRDGEDQPTDSPVTGEGLVVLLTTSPELPWTNLPAKPLMVPMLHELIKQGVGLVRTSQRYTAGERPRLGLSAAAATLVDPRGRRISLDAFGRPVHPLERSGLYTIADHADQTIGTIAVNVDTVAGRTLPQGQDAVNEWLGHSGPWQVFDAGDPAAALRTAESGSPLAGALLLAVLGLVVIETALARWFSHAAPKRTQRFGAGLRADVARVPATPGGVP